MELFKVEVMEEVIAPGAIIMVIGFLVLLLILTIYIKNR